MMQLYFNSKYLKIYKFLGHLDPTKGTITNNYSEIKYKEKKIACITKR